MDPQIKKAIERAMANAGWHDRQDGFRADSAESANFTRQLVKVRAKAFEVQYANLTGRTFVAVNHEPDTADTSYEYQWFDRVGRAEVGGNYNSGGPRVDVFGNDASQKIVPVTDSYGYSIQEARAAARSGSQLPARKARAAREVIETRLDEIMLVGDTTASLSGLFNLTGTLTYTIPNGAAASPLWVNKTPTEILADMNGITNAVVENSLEIEKPDTMVMPLAQLHLIATTARSTTSDTTILEYFLATNKYIKRVDSHAQLAGIGASSADRLMVYQNSPDKVEMIIPQEFEQFAPQALGFELVTNCHARTGGVVLYLPKSVNYGDGI